MIATIAGFLGIRELFVKLGLGLVTLLAIGFAVWRVVAWYDSQLDAAEKRGAAAAYARVEHRVIEMSRQLTTAAEALRSKAGEETRVVVAAADDLRVRGPGKAACPAVPVTSSGGPVAAATETGPAVAPLPDRTGTELVCLPFAGTVDVFEQHDRLLIESRSWRDNHTAQTKIISKEQK
jgi:hypothetical protein